MKKLYCYVDETGQDTKGEIFIVGVVIIEQNQDLLEEALLKIEKSTKKNNRKWLQTIKQIKPMYIKEVLHLQTFQGRLFYAVYHNNQAYTSMTVHTIERAIYQFTNEPYEATLLIDGLQKSVVEQFGRELRVLGVKVRKVRGIKKEEYNALSRLADAVCGFIREAMLKGVFLDIFREAHEKGWIIRL